MSQKLQFGKAAGEVPELEMAAAKVAMEFGVEQKQQNHSMSAPEEVVWGRMWG